MTVAQSYGMAAGYNVADASIQTFKTQLLSYLDGIPFVIRSQPVNRYPVRTTLLSSAVYGDGTPLHTLIIPVLSRSAHARLQTVYLSSGSLLSAKVTLRTRLHDLDTWSRYNAYFVLYNPAEDGDYPEGEGEFQNLQLRFNLVQRLD